MAYVIDKLNDRTDRIIDKDGGLLYLLKGDVETLLIDTGMDTDNLYQYLLQQTDKPLNVILTHGHIDHIGRTGDFPDHVNIYLHEKDLDIYTAHTHFSNGKYQASQLKFRSPDKLLPMPDQFHPGGICLEAVPLGGHTPGSVLFVDKTNKTVFTGDAIGSGCGCWMQIEGCLTIEEYHTHLIEACRHLEELGVDETWRFCGGHYQQEYQSRVSCCNIPDLRLLKDMIILCQRILDKNTSYHELHCMVRDGCTPYYTSYGKAELIMTKESIRS